MPEYKPRFDYDKEADVLYISFGKPKPCRTDESCDGVVIRHTLDGKLNGITIIDYDKRAGNERI